MEQRKMKKMWKMNQKTRLSQSRILPESKKDSHPLQKFEPREGNKNKPER